ncbi:MAG: signal peptidase II [Usitatibacter sp.]
MLRPAQPGWTRWLALAGAVIVADLATKAWITSAFRHGEVREMTPFFNLVLAHNTGAAFSFLAGAGGWQRWFFAIIAVAISAGIVVILRGHAGKRLFALALALVLGGALGNLYDRVSLGYVVDFVQLHAAGYYWPAFNVADSAICVGVALLLWDGLKSGAAVPSSTVVRQEKP